MSNERQYTNRYHNIPSQISRTQYKTQIRQKRNFLPEKKVPEKRLIKPSIFQYPFRPTAEISHVQNYSVSLNDNNQVYNTTKGFLPSHGRTSRRENMDKKVGKNFDNVLI